MALAFSFDDLLGSSNVVTTTMTFARNPDCATRILVSRTVMYSGSDLYVCQFRERIDVGLNQRTMYGDLPQKLILGFFVSQRWFEVPILLE
jgi:hypothetical protein